MVAVVFRGAIAAEEHKALLDCALTRNADKACEVLTQHVNGCVTYTLKGGALK
jgi:DNA-binding GntR family transcriptional regulator